MALEWIKSIKSDRILHLYAEYDEASPDVVEFWSNALDAYAKEKLRLDFQYAEIEKAFVFDGVYPSSLKQTIPLLEKQGRLVSAKDIQQDDNKTEDSLVSILITSFSSFFSPSKAAPADISNETYLFTSVLSEIVRAVAAAATSRNDYDLVFSTSSALSSVNTFHSFLTSPDVIAQTKLPIYKQLILGLTEQQAHFVMDYLVNQNMGVYSNPQHNNIYASQHTADPSPSSSANVNHSSDAHKLLATPKSLFQLWTVSPGANSTLSNAFVAVYVLKHSLDSVDKHMQKVEDKIQGYARQALAAHRAGSSKEALLGILHLKKLYTQNLDKLRGTKLHLEKSLITLEETKQNAAILEAYQTATLSMKAYREQHELLKNGADGVADALDAFQDELDELTQVNEMIEGVVVSKIDADEEEGLEKELEELMGGNPVVGPVVNSGQGKVVQLPSVPSSAVAARQVVVEETEEQEFDNTQATLS